MILNEPRTPFHVRRTEERAYLSLIVGPTCALPPSHGTHGIRGNAADGPATEASLVRLRAHYVTGSRDLFVHLFLTGLRVDIGVYLPALKGWRYGIG